MVTRFDLAQLLGKRDPDLLARSGEPPTTDSAVATLAEHKKVELGVLTAQLKPPHERIVAEPQIAPHAILTAQTLLSAGVVFEPERDRRVGVRIDALHIPPIYGLLHNPSVWKMRL